MPDKTPDGVENTLTIGHIVLAFGPGNTGRSSTREMVRPERAAPIPGTNTLHGYPCFGNTVNLKM